MAFCRGPDAYASESVNPDEYTRWLCCATAADSSSEVALRNLGLLGLLMSGGLDVGVDFKECELTTPAVRSRVISIRLPSDEARLGLDTSSFDATGKARANTPAKHRETLEGGETALRYLSKPKRDRDAAALIRAIKAGGERVELAPAEGVATDHATERLDGGDLTARGCG
ncbi:hypothetical protein M885DRAFT_562141 [Pelagophyceae sp. CCMP2097]|nr:hypothetical protein M885DRAFT_562141 [Pelagophyceae sp. CCMP2097]